MTPTSLVIAALCRGGNPAIARILAPALGLIGLKARTHQSDVFLLSQVYMSIV